MNIDNTKNNFYGFILWLLWIIIVTIVLGSIAYLFIGGSKFFNKYNSPPIVVYKQIDEQKGLVSVNGSVVLPSQCDRLKLEVVGTLQDRILNFNIEKDKDCTLKGDTSIPQTFFTEFTGNKDTNIRITIDNIEQEVILK